MPTKQSWFNDILEKNMIAAYLYSLQQLIILKQYHVTVAQGYNYIFVYTMLAKWDQSVRYVLSGTVFSDYSFK